MFNHSDINSDKNSDIIFSKNETISQYCVCVLGCCQVDVKERISNT